MKTTTRTWVFLGTLTLTTLVIGHVVGGRQGLLLALIITLSINFYVLFFGRQQWISLYRAQRVEGQDPWNLISVTRELAAAARLRPPKIYVFPVATPTAFSTGRNINNASILLSEGLLKEFSTEEVTAVLAYEISQIQRRNTLAYEVGAALAEILMTPAKWFDTLTTLISLTTFTRREKRGGRRHRFFSTLMFPFAAIVIAAAATRRSFYENDATAAHLIQSPEVLAQVLWKLNSHAATRSFLVPFPVAHLFIVNPLTLGGWTRYFQTQPPVEMRIHKLIGRFPI